jgi:hypothetical protein
MAPDDGQFIKIEGTSEFKKKRYLTGKIKVLKETSSVSRKSWNLPGPLNSAPNAVSVEIIRITVNSPARIVGIQATEIT